MFRWGLRYTGGDSYTTGPNDMSRHVPVPRRHAKASRRPRARSVALAREVERWQNILAPKLRDVDPHDLHLILWSLLRRRYGGERRFLLRRRKEGGYVF